MNPQKTLSATSRQAIKPTSLFLEGKEVDFQKILGVHLVLLDRLVTKATSPSWSGTPLLEDCLRVIQTLRGLYPPPLSRAVLRKVATVHNFRLPKKALLMGWVNSQEVNHALTPAPGELEALGDYLYLTLTQGEHLLDHTDICMWSIWEAWWSAVGNTQCSVEVSRT